MISSVLDFVRTHSLADHVHTKDDKAVLKTPGARASGR